MRHYVEFLQIWSHLVEVLKVEGVCSAKMIPIQEGSTELHMHENCVLFLPVNVLTPRCSALAFLAARHTTMIVYVIRHYLKH